MAGAETTALWRERVRAWRATGLRADAFAQDEGYRDSKLCSWANCLGPNKAPQFARRLPPASTQALRWSMLAEVGSACSRVEPGFDPALLSDVVEALEGRCGFRKGSQSAS